MNRLAELIRREQGTVVPPSVLDSLGGTTRAELEETLPAPSNTHSPGQTSSVEEKALNLLGSGISAEQVASALGVTPSRISQLLSSEDFAEKVAVIRYENLQKHNVRDNKYDSLEDLLLDKLKLSLGLMFKPETILKAIATVNGAKRRGQVVQDQVTDRSTVVNLILPNVIAAKFVVNIDNQVTRAGDQDLVTMQSGSLLKKSEELVEEKRQEERAIPAEFTETE